MRGRKRVGLLLFGLVLMTVICALLLANDSRLRGDIKGYQSAIKAEAEKTQVWRDKAGQSHAARLVAEGELGVMKDVYAKDLDAIKKQVTGLKKDLSNLQGVVTVSGRTGGEFRMGLKDTIVVNNNHYDTARSFRYRDKWASVHGIFTRDSALVFPSFKDSITFVTYYKRKNWFEDRELRIEAISHNPYSTLTGIRQIKINERKKRFGIGPYVGFGVNGWSVGIGIQYNVIKF